MVLAGHKHTMALDQSALLEVLEALSACLKTQAARGWASVGWRARRRVITMIIAQ